ncbi:DUF5908 family protein [Enterobacter bugandensis]|uniref:DUF5908 family protein n=1 Tax=Enterobacter bugandensis TaxID=881260 RepID=UPI003A10179E
MTIEIRELIIEARVSESNENISSVQASGHLSNEELKRIVDSISRQVLSQIRDELRWRK